MFDKRALLDLFAQAKLRAIDGELDIVAQHQIITALEQKGIDSDKARMVLARLIAAQEIDLAKMERLLDELDRGPNGTTH